MKRGADMENEKSYLIEYKLDRGLPRRRRYAGAAGCVVILLVVSIVITLSVNATTTNSKSGRLLSDKSIAGIYTQGAVISDYQPCSKIGSDVMRLHNGSAVDAAVATALCVGVTDIQACGLGGGLFMTIYDTPKHGTTKMGMTVNGRGMAPLSAYRDMFKDVEDPGKGAQAIAVPGELRGLHEAWLRFGRLPWKQLVQPAIDIARSGFTISPQQAEHIPPVMKYFKRYPNLRNLLMKDDVTPFGAGDVMKRPQMAYTLERIRDEGPDTFYSGSLAEDIIADIQDAGGNMTMTDLEEYTANAESPLSISLANGETDLLVPQLPSGGPILQFVLRVMEGFNFTSPSQQDLNLNLDLHQAIIETFKFAFAMRSYLGDADLVNVTEPMRNLTSSDFIRGVRSQIDLQTTHSLEYYHAAYSPASQHGTAHLSVLSPDGAVVSLTSSINYYFGSFIIGERTGIIFNNEMDDFSSPNSNNEWGLRPSEANFIEPRKRPLSSISPAILLDHVTKQPRLVIGGAGGSRITTAVALVTYLNQNCGLDLLSSVDFPRVHHQLLPEVVSYESEVATYIIDGLSARGHAVLLKQSRAAVNGIHRRCDDHGVCVSTAVGDSRRGGKPWGWN